MEIFFCGCAKLPEISGWLVHWDYNFINHEHILTLIMSHLYTKKLDINIFFHYTEHTMQQEHKTTIPKQMTLKHEV